MYISKIILSFFILLTNLNTNEINLVELLSKLEKEMISIDQFASVVKEQYCLITTKAENENGVECRLSKSLTNQLYASNIYLTIDNNTPEKVIYFSISGYGKGNELKRIESVEVDFNSLIFELQQIFTLQSEEYVEGAESPEKTIKTFVNQSNIEIEVMKLIGGCLEDRRIIITIQQFTN